MPLWLSELPNAWLIIPLANGGELIGFVILATARTRIDVNWEVNDLLKTAARQAATFLGQMQATEALLEARKFDAFNRMSAFVVHDLKNIVAQLSLMLKNAERHRDNPEFQKDMLMTVEHSVERMKQLMMQLREGTTPVTRRMASISAAVIGRIQRAKASQQPVPEIRLEDKVAGEGHEDRLERVIGHLVQNAIDATDKDGRVWIRLAKQDGQALVEVGDTGHGMTPEFVRERLFKPFQTTKATGMGIGAYESFQYVQELGGRVQVDSTPDVGTQVRVVAAAVRVRRRWPRGSRRRWATGMSDKARPLLIVEDDPSLQKQICWAFDQYEPLPAADRESALAQLRRHAPAGGDDGSRPAAGSRFRHRRLQAARADPRARAGHQGDRPDRAERPRQRACGRSDLAPTTSLPSRSSPICWR